MLYAAAGLCNEYFEYMVYTKMQGESINYSKMFAFVFARIFFEYKSSHGIFNIQPRTRRCSNHQKNSQSW